MVALLERLLTETSPVVFAVDSLGHLERNVEVAALDGQIEPSRLVLHKVEGNLQLSRTPSQPHRAQLATHRNAQRNSPPGTPSSASRQ